MLERLDGIKRKAAIGLAALCLAGSVSTTGCETLNDGRNGETMETLKTIGIPLAAAAAGVLIGYLIWGDGNEEKKEFTKIDKDCVEEKETGEIYCKLYESDDYTFSADKYAVIDDMGTFYLRSPVEQAGNTVKHKETETKDGDHVRKIDYDKKKRLQEKHMDHYKQNKQDKD